MRPFLIFLAASLSFAIAFWLPSGFSPTHPSHYIISDEQGNILSAVSVKVSPGDEFLTAANELYVITDVHRQLAHAKFIRKIYLH